MDIQSFFESPKNNVPFDMTDYQRYKYYSVNRFDNEYIQLGRREFYPNNTEITPRLRPVRFSTSPNVNYPPFFFSEETDGPVLINSLRASYAPVNLS
jgi:hypothetical protein